jgi:hypothetical protein
MKRPSCRSHCRLEDVIVVQTRRRMDWMDGMNLLGMVWTYGCSKKRGKVVVVVLQCRASRKNI